MLDRPDEPRRISDHVLNKLAAVTADAKRGNVEAIVIITVSPDGQPHPHFAGDTDLMPSINMGIDMAKQVILNRIIGTPGAVQMNSGIIMPGK